MATTKTAPTVTVNILNHMGDETRDLLLGEAFALIDQNMADGMWAFNDATNEMLTDKKGVRNAFSDGGSATLMPASVGG